MTENVQILMPTIMLTHNDQNDLKLIESPKSISDKHKKDVRKLLRTEYGGKSFETDAYLSLIKNVSDKYNIEQNKLHDFMNSYTVTVDTKIFIFPKKIANKVKARKTKISDDNQKIVNGLNIINNNNKNNIEPVDGKLNDKLDIKIDVPSPININDEQNQKSNDQLEVIPSVIDNNTSVSPPTKLIRKKTRIVTRVKQKTPSIIPTEIMTPDKSIDKSTTYEQYNNQPLPDGVHIIKFQTPQTKQIQQSENSQFPYNVPKQIQPKPTKYTYPTEIIAARIHRESKYGPHGTQWINDIQTNDVITHEIQQRQIAVQKLLEIKVPEQRSAGWFAMREERITASDGGCVLGMNDYEPKYKFILKKVVGSQFKGNKFCYHGKKYEKAAIMIYEYRFNVALNEFGLIGHPSIRFLGASPDGIVGLFKNDGTHYTKFVGRMLEIKCPLSRKIELEGDIDDICPIYYQIQVQLQLECCDLDECDFWQCKITEYMSRMEFINDTDPIEQFRSKQTGFEKGCLIQLIPKSKMREIIETNKYWDNVYDDAIFLYPPKIEMTPCDCDIWISKTLASLHATHPDYVFDKVLYWKLERSHCLLIERDKKWFAEKLPELERMWSYVEFFRSNKSKLDILLNYIDSLSLKTSKKIMKVVEELAKIPKPGTAEEILYNEYINKLNEEIAVNNVSKAENDDRKEERKAQKNSEKNEKKDSLGNNIYMF